MALLDRRSVLRAGVIAVAAGAAVCIAIPILAGVGLTWWPSIQMVGYLLAAAAVSGVIGFIFGVPRARTETATTPTSKTRFEANSNLEQISDWLTKLLVGAGLVQLALLPAFLRKIGEYLGASLGFPGGPAAAVAMVLYGAGVGFIILYLWARLGFRILLEQSELQARGVWESIEADLQTEEQSSDEPRSAREVTRAVDQAQRFARNGIRFASVLWVDDNPGNNRTLVRNLTNVGVDVFAVRSTEEAVRELRYQNFGLVITDYGRTEHGEYVEDAGLRLIHTLAEFSVGTPVLVYTGSNGQRHAGELREAGARLVTSSPSELFEWAIRLLSARRG